MTHKGGINVFKKYLFASGVALLSASVAVGAQSAAQSSSSSDDQSQSSSSAATQSDTQSSTSTAQSSSTEPTATLVGCLYREKDIPGRSPNVAERVGVMEDYILADAQPKAASTSADASSTTGSSTTTEGNDSTGAVGTSGTMTSGGKMYKLEHVSDEILGALVGKRGEVIGRIDKEPGDQTSTQGGAAIAQDNSAGPDRIELAEFEVTSIQATAGTCPAQPSSAR
jgi:hypothetical protein